MLAILKHSVLVINIIVIKLNRSLIRRIKILSWLSVFKLKINSRSLHLIWSSEVFGNGSLHVSGHSWFRSLVCAAKPLRSISGICTDCSTCDRQVLLAWVLPPLISETSINLYLLTFKFPLSGKSEVKPIYKRLFLKKKNKKNNLKIWRY